MRLVVALFYIMDAAAVNWDVTFMIYGATGIGDYYPLSDKTDPFAGIFVDGRQVGLTPTRWNDYTPMWMKRISFSVDLQEATSSICLAVFDRSTVDGSDAGASYHEMSTKNGLIDARCMNVIGWGGGDEEWICYTASCPSVTLTDQTVKLSDDTDVKVTYDIEITTSHPPPPPSYSSRAGSGGSNGGSTRGSSSYTAPSSNSKTIRIPRVVARVLGGLGGAVVCCLLSYLRHVCKRATAAGGRSSEDEERNAPRGTPSSRSQTDPNAISVEMESASPSASVVLTPMSEVEREQYVCLYKSLGGCPVGRSEAAPTLERAQLPPEELDVIWELYEEHCQRAILAHRQSHSNCSAADAWRPGPRGLTARYSRRQCVYPRQLRSDLDADGRLDEQALGFTQPLISFDLADLRTCLLTYTLSTVSYSIRTHSLSR